MKFSTFLPALLALCLLSTTFIAEARPSKAQQLVPLPASTLGPGTPGTTGTTTNFSTGWNAVTAWTNIQGSLYTNNLNGSGQAGFYNLTNIVFTTNATSARFDFTRYDTLGLEWSGQASGTGATNTTFTFGKSVKGVSPDTLSQFTWTIPVNGGTTPTVAVTNFPADFLGGDGYLFVVSQTWNGTNATTGTLTNLYGGIYGGTY